MAHFVKCFYCGDRFDRDIEPNIKVSGRRYAHLQCAEEQGETESIKSQKDKDLFYEYVKRIYGKDYNYMMINKQAENYMKEYGYTWGGMAGTLHWFYDIEHGSTEEGHGGIGIIPFVYEQAKKYYSTVNKAEAMSKEMKLRTPIIHINIQSPRAWHQPPHLLDLEEDE